VLERYIIDGKEMLDPVLMAKARECSTNHSESKRLVPSRHKRSEETNR
jgi:hypothetical protein